ncbi:MAG: DUF1285 domain-containing protein [Alphaproteobacteria bacterium]|nr:DUF1285 domain-containing protein [Alphaproteobacteria bacterium]MCB9929185.1 DUF1285 domain-containing protein [Alphaproteobacteria bacterium]
MSDSTPDLSILTEGLAANNGPARRPSGHDRPCVDFGIRIAKDGTWYHNGLPFRRPALVKLFSTVMTRADNGDYLLATPVERGTIEVEDAPFVAVEMRAEGEGRDQVLTFRTNIDEWVRADADHPLWLVIDEANAEPRPYLLVRPGLEALIVRSVFYDLVELAEEQPDGSLAVWSGGALHSLGQASA